MDTIPEVEKPPITYLTRRAALDPQAIEEHLAALSRGPFVKVLVDFLGCQPTIESIQEFADKSPDRWMQAVTMIAKLAGYHEKLEVTGDVRLHIGAMSDSDLDNAIKTLEHEMIDVTPTEDGQNLTDPTTTSDPVKSSG